MSSIDIYQDKEGLADIMDICEGYNYNNIYNDIEKKAFNNNFK